jgi:hypothetical protein
MPAFFAIPLSQLTTKWRIFHEESADSTPRDEQSDLQELRGYYDTRIYRHGQTELAVSTDTPHVYNRLVRTLPGLTKKTGSVLLFPDMLLDTVAVAIRARRRPQFSEEVLARKRERGRALSLAHKAMTKGQNPALETPIAPEREPAPVPDQEKPL